MTSALFPKMNKQNRSNRSYIVLKKLSDRRYGIRGRPYQQGVRSKNSEPQDNNFRHSYLNEFNFENFYNYSLYLFSIQRMDGTVISVNPSFPHILEWPDEELLGQNPFHLVHPEDMEVLIQEFQKFNQNLSQ